MIYIAIYGAIYIANVFLYLQFKQRIIAYWFIILLLFIFVAFRWEVGCDWPSYKEQFNAFAYRSIFTGELAGELGYWALIEILHYLGLPYEYLNVVAATVFFYGLNELAKRQPDRLLFISVSFPVLITGIVMSATRQTLALGILYLAFNAFIDQKKLKFAICVLVASTFHQSAIVFVALLPLVLDISQRNKIIALILMFVPAVIIGSSALVTKYSEMYIYGNQEAFGGWIRSTLNLLTGSMFFLFLNKGWRSSCPRDHLFAQIVSVGLIVVLPITLASTVIGDRFGYYLMSYGTAIQARAYLLVERRSAFAFYHFVLLLNGLVLVGWSMLSSLFQICYVPYHTWWDAVPYVSKLWR